MGAALRVVAGESVVGVAVAEQRIVRVCAFFDARGERVRESAGTAGKVEGADVEAGPVCVQWMCERMCVHSCEGACTCQYEHVCVCKQARYEHAHTHTLAHLLGALGL